jgi:hypothetical protein
MRTSVILLFVTASISGCGGTESKPLTESTRHLCRIEASESASTPDEALTRYSACLCRHTCADVSSSPDEALNCYTKCKAEDQSAYTIR